tara:strand:+ start:51 stop:668 length:618 start_codon:yes stop_codon:yes gene_type:complete
MIYELGHIYAIWDCEDHNLIYYGSTGDLNNRMRVHKETKNQCKSKKIIERGNYEYAILETYENIDEYDLHERERWYIENKVCVNKVVPHRTKAEYRQNNKEKFAEYRQNNKEKLAEQKKEYYQDNKEKIAEQRKEYYQDNKEKFAERNKEYRQNNKEKIKEIQKEYYQKTKQNIRCPHCDKELNKYYLKSHIKKYCKKKQIIHQS